MKDRIASDYFSGAYYAASPDEIGICYADAAQFGLTPEECFNDGMMKDLVIINMEEGTRYKLQSTQGSNNTLVFKYDGQEFNPRNVYFVDNSANAGTPVSKTLTVVAEATQCITLYTYQDRTTSITIKSLLADGSEGLSDSTTLIIEGSSNYDKQVVWITGSDGGHVNVSIEWFATGHTQPPMQGLITQHELRLGQQTTLQDGQAIV